jgi:hypothetical protein
MTTTQPTLDCGMMPKMQVPSMPRSDSKRSLHSIEEFEDKLGKKLGEHYGLADIRELL